MSSKLDPTLQPRKRVLNNKQITINMVREVNETTDNLELDVIEMLHPEMIDSINEIRHKKTILAIKERNRQKDLDNLIKLHRVQLDSIK